MPPLVLIPALSLLLFPVPARAGDANRQAGDAASLSVGAAQAGDLTAASAGASQAFSGNRAEGAVVVAPGVTRRAEQLATPAPGSLKAKVEPPPGVAQTPPADGILTKNMKLGAAAIIGGLQGWFTSGLSGALTGAGLGLAAAWLFHKGDYGGSFGITVGAIIGGALGGPLGGLVGAVLGGLLGHFLGKAFL